MGGSGPMARMQEVGFFFSLSPDLLCIADFDGHFIQLNPAWKKTLGWSMDQLRSRPYLEFVHPDDRERTLDETQRLIRDTATLSFENRYVCSDASYKWLRWTCTSQPDRRRIYANVRDITELRELREDLLRAQETLEDQVHQRTQQWQRTNDFLNSLIDACPHAIVAVDIQRNVRVWNAAATRIFGWTAGEAIGGRVPFVNDEKREESNTFNDRALRGELFTNYEIQRSRRDGTTVDLLVSAGPTHDSAGAIDGFLTVATDMTEHKKLEQQFLRAQRMESLGTLASGIAHDLNNVLAPIGMSLQLFRMKSLDPSMNGTLDVLDSCVTRGANLIRQVLTFARGVQGERAPVQTERLILDTEKVLSQTLPKSITVRSKVPRDLWAVAADTTQFHQVLMNLCINARDAMPEGGRLTISAQNVLLDETYIQLNPGLLTGPYVVIEVQDTGHGMTAEIQKKVFEPFFTTKEMGMGTGLGLSTVAAIVRSHGGFVNLYSEVGRGTSFKIYFPALPGQQNQGASNGLTSLPMGTGELILIVEDEAAVRDIARLVLETHGYQVIEAQDGAEGIAVYAKHREEIRLVISDMDMPVMDGAAMIRSLETINPSVRVISASGLTFNGRSLQNSERTSPYRMTLPKPYTASDLLHSVDTVIKTA